MTEQSLRKLRVRALAAVESDVVHHLRLGFREAIWAEFGPRAQPPRRLTKPHLQRISLAVNGVRHVLPLWERRFPGEELPFSALSAIDDLLKHSRPPAQSQPIFDELWDRLLHLASEKPASEVAVGFAAVQALSTAMYDEFFNAADLDLERNDTSDPESHDSAYYSGAAQAGGLPGGKKSNAERRLSFWRWWLNEGIDAAINANFLQKP